MADEVKPDEVLQEPMIWQPGGKGGVYYDRGTRAADMAEPAVEQARAQGFFDAETVSIRTRAAPHLGAFSGLSPDDVSRPVGAARGVVGPAETVKVMRAVKDSKTGEEEEVDEVPEEVPPTPPQFDTLSTDDASHPVGPPVEGTIPPAPTSNLSPDDASAPATAPVTVEMTTEEKELEQQLNPSDPSTGTRTSPENPDKESLDKLSKNPTAKEQADHPSDPAQSAADKEPSGSKAQASKDAAKELDKTVIQPKKK